MLVINVLKLLTAIQVIFYYTTRANQEYLDELVDSRIGIDLTTSKKTNQTNYNSFTKAIISNFIITQ